MHKSMTLIGLSAAALLVPAANAWAGNVVAVPEISPASVSAGLAVLAGGVLVFRSRMRRK